MDKPTAVNDGMAVADQESAQGVSLRAVVAEFGRLLYVLGGQLGASLQEADRECMAVGESFHELAAANSRIEGISCQEPEQTAMRQSCKLIAGSLNAAVVALQYHDRLAQRVGHIRAGLNRLQDLLLDGSARSHEEWLLLLCDIEQANNLELQRLAAKTMPVDAGETALTATSHGIELF
jgi:hypothetical protein